MAFDPDAATQALINQMLQEDLQLADARPSAWDHLPSAEPSQPPEYRLSNEDLYGNASDEEDWIGEDSDGERRNEKDDEYDENNEEDDDDEDHDQLEEGDSSIESIANTKEALEAVTNMERIAQEQGVPGAEIYATGNGCTVEQATRELGILNTTLQPHPPRTITRPAHLQSVHAEHIECTATPGAWPQINSSTSTRTDRLGTRHGPDLHPPCAAIVNPLPPQHARHIRLQPVTTDWLTQSGRPSGIDWNAVPPHEHLDGGLLKDAPPENDPTAANVNYTGTRDVGELFPRGDISARDIGENMGLPSYLMDGNIDFTTGDLIRGVAQGLVSGPAPSQSSTSRTALNRPPQPPTSFTTGGPFSRPPPFSSQRRHQRSRHPPRIYEFAERVVEDDMGTFILIPWKDEGREEDMESGGYAGIRRGVRRRKERQVAEIRVGEEETLEKILGGFCL